MAHKSNKTTFDIKSANLPVISFILKATDLKALAQELNVHFGSRPDYFSNDPVVIDLRQLTSEKTEINFQQLKLLLENYSMAPFAVCTLDEQHISAAKQAGLIITPETTHTIPRPPQDDAPVQRHEPVMVPIPATSNTMVIDKPLRSGQQVYARGTDLIVTSLVSFGAEIIADGNIHVYAPLRGRVVAGAQGNTQARIYSTCFEPELLAIAGIYRTTETPLPANIFGKPAMVILENETLNILPIALQAH